MEWLNDNTIKINPPKKPKKITGTRFASVLDYNPWQTEFETWCAITRVYEKPFEDTIYTAAGKAIEPKQIEYLRTAYAMDNLVTPTDRFGEDYFNKTWGDFFPDSPQFGGMWDSLLIDENGDVEAVIEFKTTKRAEDWQDDIPDYYALQAALYANLLETDNVIMVASILEDKDYADPAKFKPSVKNTIIKEFKVSERYPDFDLYLASALTWWDKHVIKGISPVFDEKKDAEILKALRTTTLSPDTDINDLIKEAEELKVEIDKVTATLGDSEKRLKKINDVIKEYAIGQFKNGDKNVEIKGNTYTWNISKSETVTIDKEALTADGLIDKYSKKSESYRLTVK